MVSFSLASTISMAHLGVREKDMGEANEGAAELARCVDNRRSSPLV